MLERGKHKWFLRDKKDSRKEEGKIGAKKLLNERKKTSANKIRCLENIFFGYFIQNAKF
jgi:hypothetical protein